MFVVHHCARCRHPLRIRGCYQGKTVRCPGCAAVLTVPETAAAGSDAPVHRKVRAAPCHGGNSKADERRPSSRLVLPWLPLAPALVVLGLLAWAGHGVLWAALGVGLGSLFLLVGQRACWPLSLRVGPSLSLAALGHGLTLAVPLVNTPLPQPILAAAGQPADAPPLTLNLPSQPAAPLPAMTSMTNQPRLNNRNKPTAPDLVPVATQLGALLAVAVDADASGGNAYITTADGSLKQFSYPAFQLQATYRLPQPAYRAVMDQRRGLLWVAASDPGSLRVNDYGDRPEGFGNLHAYDIRALGRPTTTDSQLRPRHVLPLQGTVLELIASTEGRWLFYLARTAEGVHLGRIDAEQQCIDARVPLTAETQALCRTPDGKTLYAAGGRNVFVIDPVSLQARRRLEMDAEINTVAADNEGRVYLSEQGQWTSLTWVDLSGPEPTIRQWDPKMHGRLYLRLAPDQHRLYVGTSSVLCHHLDSLLTRGHEWNTPPQVGSAHSDAHGPIRGEFFLTSDGHYLVNRWGRVFRLAQGEMSLPRFHTVGEQH